MANIIVKEKELSSSITSDICATRTRVVSLGYSYRNTYATNLLVAKCDVITSAGSEFRNGSATCVGLLLKVSGTWQTYSSTGASSYTVGNGTYRALFTLTCESRSVTTYLDGTVVYGSWTAYTITSSAPGSEVTVTGSETNYYQAFRVGTSSISGTSPTSYSKYVIINVAVNTGLITRQSSGLLIVLQQAGPYMIVYYGSSKGTSAPSFSSGRTTYTSTTRSCNGYTYYTYHSTSTIYAYNTSGTRVSLSKSSSYYIGVFTVSGSSYIRRAVGAVDFHTGSTWVGPGSSYKMMFTDVSLGWLWYSGGTFTFTVLPLGYGIRCEGSFSSTIAYNSYWESGTMTTGVTTYYRRATETSCAINVLTAS